MVDSFSNVSEAFLAELCGVFCLYIDFQFSSATPQKQTGF